MTRRPRRTRYAALALELAGVGAVLYGVALFSVIAAFVVAGIVAIVAAQFVEQLV